jgi:hypothetical protein
MYICIYVYIYTYTYMYIYMCICIHICICTSIHIGVLIRFFDTSIPSGGFRYSPRAVQRCFLRFIFCRDFWRSWECSWGLLGRSWRPKGCQMGLRSEPKALPRAPKIPAENEPQKAPLDCTRGVPETTGRYACIKKSD